LFEVVEAEAVGPESEEGLQVRIITGPSLTTGLEYPSRIRRDFRIYFGSGRRSIMFQIIFIWQYGIKLTDPRTSFQKEENLVPD
jgi:hypothetical protein